MGRDICTQCSDVCTQCSDICTQCSDVCATCPASLICLVSRESSTPGVKLIGDHTLSFYCCPTCQKAYVRVFWHAAAPSLTEKEMAVTLRCPVLAGITGEERGSKLVVCEDCYAFYNKVRLAMGEGD